MKTSINLIDQFRTRCLVILFFFQFKTGLLVQHPVCFHSRRADWMIQFQLNSHFIIAFHFCCSDFPFTTRGYIGWTINTAIHRQLCNWKIYKACLSIRNMLEFTALRLWCIKKKMSTASISLTNCAVNCDFAINDQFDMPISTVTYRLLHILRCDGRKIECRTYFSNECYRVKTKITYFIFIQITSQFSHIEIIRSLFFCKSNLLKFSRIEIIWHPPEFWFVKYYTWFFYNVNPFAIYMLPLEL